MGDVVEDLEVPGAQGADPPAKRARYSFTSKDDSTCPGAVPADVPGAPSPNAAAAVDSDRSACAAKLGE